MKVLVVVHGFAPAAQGGAEIYAQAHATALSRAGEAVLVLTRDQDPARPEYDVRSETVDGLQVVRVNNTFRNVRSFEATYRNPEIGKIADRVIESFNPDIAHVHHLTCLSTTIVESLARRAIPCIMTLHDYWLLCHRGQLLDTAFQVCAGPRGPGDGVACHNCLGQAGGTGSAGFAGAAIVRRIDRHLPASLSAPFKQAASAAGMVFHDRERDTAEWRRRVAHMRALCDQVTHFVAPSRHMRDRFVEFGVPSERITHSPYGFATPQGPARRDEDHPARPLKLGFFGSLMVSKAPHVLLNAIRRLPERAVTVDVYGACTPYHGDDSYRARLEPLLQHPAVRVHGLLPHDRVHQALRSLDALVVPSIWPENSPLVIQEAFLAGTPVVASRIGGIPEVVDDGQNGLLFEAGNDESLAGVLSRLLENPGVIEALRRRLPAVRTIDDDAAWSRSLYERCSSSACEPTHISAVVLNYRTPDETLITVRSLLAGSRPLSGIIVVDNEAARDSALQRALDSLGAAITYLPVAENLGYAGGMNLGIKAALAKGAGMVLLVNSDVFVPPDAVLRLERALERRREAGIAGPVVVARSNPDRVASCGMSYRMSSGRMRHSGSGARVDESSAQDRFVDGVSGCAMLVRKDVFDTAGLLNEAYFFGFEDLEFCLRARGAGFSTVVACGAEVHHEGSRSIGPASAKRLYFAARNHLLLARHVSPSSWGGISPARALSIVMLNLAHAVRAPGPALPRRLGAVVAGVADYAAGRFGSGSTGLGRML